MAELCRDILPVISAELSAPESSCFVKAVPIATAIEEFTLIWSASDAEEDLNLGTYVFIRTMKYMPPSEKITSGAQAAMTAGN
jgi:hypothetical protein